MDSFYASGAPLPFTPAAETGRSVALIGAGPASLSCAAELRRRGIRATLFTRALYRRLEYLRGCRIQTAAGREPARIEMLSQLGVEFHFNEMIDAQRLAELERDHDAVFLGIGRAPSTSSGSRAKTFPASPTRSI